MGRCSHASCTRRPTYNVNSSKAAYCRQHAADGMVNVENKTCLYPSCAKQPSFNVEGRHTAAYCTQHASTGLVNVK
ncbi:unnamed protein product, partial [Scytosiphon promiscuus]